MVGGSGADGGGRVWLLLLLMDMILRRQEPKRDGSVGKVAVEVYI